MKMEKSEFNEKILEEVDNLDIKKIYQDIVKSMLKHEINSYGRYEFDDYDRIFDKVLDENDNL